MREEVGYSVKDVSDKEHKELSPAWVYQIFEDKYINDNSIFSVSETHYVQKNGIVAEVTIDRMKEQELLRAQVTVDLMR